jgi:hypothetical protein
VFRRLLDGPARQLTLFEHDGPVLEVLTSEATATPAGLLFWLRARWRIENMFKYAAEHNGIDALADYGMDIGPDTRKVTNPARTAARKAVAAAEASPQKGLCRNGSTVRGPQRRRTPPCHEYTAGSTPMPSHWKAPRRRSAPYQRRSWPPTWTPTRNEPAPTLPAAACRWSCGCSRSTPKHGWPSTSTPT